MGREIIFEVHDNNKCIWPNPNNIDDALFVCGRDDATEYMARVCYNADEDEGILYLGVNDYDRYLSIKKELQEYYDRDMAEVQKAKDTLEDLREARRHTTTLKNFKDFSEVMEETQKWIDDNDWSRAGSMIEYLDKCYNKMLDLVNSDNSEDRQAVIERYKVAIIWSE